MSTLARQPQSDLDRAQRLHAVGQAANAAASAGIFERYRSRKAKQTRRAQDTALEQFAAFLQDAARGSVQVDGDALSEHPEAWRGITFGLVEGYREWLLRQGYAISTVNSRLAHIKTYAQLAGQAAMLSPGTVARIANVSDLRGQEAARVDEGREDAGVPTRIGSKKPRPVPLSDDEAERLLASPDVETGQGRRDAVLLHLALRHGLRVSEIAALTVESVEVTRDADGEPITGRLRFRRPKVAGRRHEWGDHLLTGDTLEAVAAYMEHDALAEGPLLRGSRRGGSLTSGGVNRTNLTERIRTLAAAEGIEGLTAHDCRHYAATRDGRRGESLDYLMTKYGWSSTQTAMRYVHQEGPVVVT
jgi:integrase